VDYVELEMSVFPIPHGTKKPVFKWKKLRFAKLWRLMDTAEGRRMLHRFYARGGEGLAVLCGRASENLFVLDCDSREVLDAVQKSLAERDIYAPVVISGRGGHVYLRAREGAVKGCKFAGGDVKGEGGYAVLPPTIHPSGVSYRWVNGIPRHIPTVSVDEIDFLGVELEVSGGNRRLHDDTRRYLRAGRFLTEGHRNDALFQAARDYRYVGLDISEALDDLLVIAVQSGLDAREAEATIRSPYTHNRGQVADGTLSLHRQLVGFARTHDWGTGSGETDRAVFLALAVRRRDDAHRIGGGVFRASYREIALEAKFNSISTVSRALKRLEAQGFIRSMGRDTETGASLWQFENDVFLKTKKNIKQHLAERSSYCSFLHSDDSPADDLQERGILGRLGYKVLTILRQVGVALAPEHIAFMVDCHITTAKRHLGKLVDMGLADVQADAFVAVDLSRQAELAIVRESGAMACAEKREVRFELDRANFILTPILNYLGGRQ
jgi:DNA-binding MarR family transcriptional regulator